MRFRTITLVSTALLMALSLVSAASASTPSHPQTGLYRSSAFAGTKFEFRIKVAVCPPDERGGNQHQKKGYCFVPVGNGALPATPCPGGATFNDEYYDLFNVLIPSSGKIKSPLTSSSEAFGEFHITIGRHGTASGYMELTTVHYAPGTETPEKCPSGRIAFTAKRV
jgi:hypothetical protein